MRAPRVLAVAALAVLAACTTTAEKRSVAELQREVADTERAFAKTMADRDYAAFASFLSDEAIFFSGSKALRGKPAVAMAWQPFYEKAEPPFAWEPDQVEVQNSGRLALSTGAVRDPAGRLIGRFNSIWRQEAPGVWRVIFDKGSEEVCTPEPKPRP